MAKKISITLDEDIIAFIDAQTSNRSQLINQILKESKRQQALKELEAAYIEQSNDNDELAEIELWDSTVGDEIDGES